MNTTNYYKLTIQDLINLATSDDLDDQELATRLVQRTALEVKQMVHGGLGTEDLVRLMNIAATTSRELRLVGEREQDEVLEDAGRDFSCNW